MPFYGRYHPRPDDFRPDPKYVGSDSEASLVYRESVLDLCSESTRIYEDTDGRDVFALGGAIIKSSHLHMGIEGLRSTRDCSYADANEVKATRLARELLGDVSVPAIYFAGKVLKIRVFHFSVQRLSSNAKRHISNNKSTALTCLFQERIPGVGLSIAWQYISRAQKQDFKKQARDILFRLHKAKPSSSPEAQSARSYIVPVPDPVSHRGIQELERDIIFSAENRDPDLGFMQNDFSLSNCIVDKDRIVGLVDWEMAGFFGWKTAAQVHVKIRTPKRENFAALDLPDEFLEDMLFWNDLYEVKQC